MSLYVLVVSYLGHNLPSSVITGWDNNLNTCPISVSLSVCFSLSNSILPIPFQLQNHTFLSFFPCFLAHPCPLSLMVTLLSDCYISSYGKSAVSPVSYHYANDGQFNFSWSEGEFLIRVRLSTQDGKKYVKTERQDRSSFKWERRGLWWSWKIYTWISIWLFAWLWAHLYFFLFFFFLHLVHLI